MSVTVTLLAAGYCTQSQHILFRGSPRKTVKFPAIYALLEHPRLGPMLFDTGYSRRFHEQTRRLPYRLYAWVTPVYVSDDDTAVQMLARRGIAAGDVTHVIISHFHADHVGGLADFPKATYVHSGACFDEVRDRRGLRAVKAGFLPGHIPPDFEARSRALEDLETCPLPAEYAPFERGVDLFGDGSVVAVDLSGHAAAQMGVFVRTTLGPAYFLVADACWHSRAYREHILPHPITKLIFADWGQYVRNFERIHELHRRNPALRIIPSHCSEVHRRFCLEASDAGASATH